MMQALAYNDRTTANFDVTFTCEPRWRIPFRAKVRYALRQLWTGGWSDVWANGWWWRTQW